MKDIGLYPFSFLSDTLFVRNDFIETITSHQATFGLELSPHTIDRLADYYELVQAHNPILHLVAPCSPGEFATRHILESLTLLEFLREGSRFADVGTGAGLPSIPCLIAREDLSAVLVESKERKAGFLRTAIAECKLTERAELVNRQFSEIPRPDVSYVTCRALDKFTEKLHQLLKWSGDCELLLFGGPALGYALRKRGRKFREKLLPLSIRRFLFIVQR